MSKTVLGVFERREAAEKAVEELRREGFSEAEVSVVGRQDGQEGNQGGREGGNGGFNLNRGTTWGAGAGVAAGLLATAGALAIPGIGPLVALGPLATTLGGAATGGVAGALVDWGIPENRGREVEQRIREGRYVALVEADGKADKAAEVLRQSGAREVEKFDKR